ncbi:MAG: hypothetical protein WDZ94_03525 [Patescibacteria group bacterium]
MPSSKVTSRLVRSERRKMTKQIFWFGSLTVVLILVFLFVVLPLFIRFVNSVLDTNPIADDQSQILLQAPVLAAPVEATNSAQLRLNGRVPGEMTVYVLVNTQEQEQTAASEDGAFETSVTLSEGQNSIVIYARDDKGTETRNSREYIVTLDTDAPEIELTSPEDEQEFDIDNPVEFAGNTDPEARVYVDSRVVFPRSDGSFSYTYRLSEGEHTILIEAIDPAGNQSEIERTIRVQD